MGRVQALENWYYFVAGTRADMSSPKGSITGNNPSGIVSALTVFLLGSFRVHLIQYLSGQLIFTYLIRRTIRKGISVNN